VEHAADDGQAAVIGSHDVTVPVFVTGGYEAIEVILTTSIGEMKRERRYWALEM